MTNRKLSRAELREWLHENYSRVCRDELLIEAQQQASMRISLCALFAATLFFAVAAVLLYFPLDELVLYAISGLVMLAFLFISMSVSYYTAAFGTHFSEDMVISFTPYRVMQQLYDKYKFG